MNIAVSIAAAGALTGACAMIGRSLASATRRRAAELNSLRAGMAQLGRLMIEMKLPLAQALARAGHELFVSAARQLCEHPKDAPSECLSHALSDMTEKGRPLDCLLADDIAALEKMIIGLGSGGASSQAALLAECERELAELAAVAAKRRDEQGKLYTTLGALFGLAAAVLLM